METPAIDNKLPDFFIFKGVLASSDDWLSYVEDLYKIFCDTLLSLPALTFQGLPIRIKRHPEYQSKHFAFWHLITEGNLEDKRTPDFRRCERLAWISWVISNADRHPDINWWENERKSQKHIVLWLEKENYAVILARRNGYLLLKSHYPVELHRAETFRKERAAATVKKP